MTDALIQGKLIKAPESRTTEATQASAPPAPRPIPWFLLGAEWRKDYAAWKAHRDTCPVCRASERTAATTGAGIRCKLGQRLHTAYEAALNNATGGYNP
ncbi:MAG: hypothetical protein ACMV1D_03550 [Macromonas sp.]